MIPFIDYSLCTGCGACAEIHPKFFEMRNDKPWFINHDRFDPEKDKSVANCCPFRAISVE